MLHLLQMGTSKVQDRAKDEGEKKFQERSYWEESNVKGKDVRVIENQNVQKDSSFEYFLHTGVRSSFLISLGLWLLRSSRMKRFQEKGKAKGKRANRFCHRLNKSK